MTTLLKRFKVKDYHVTITYCYVNRKHLIRVQETGKI